MKGAVAEGISGDKNAVDIRDRILTIRGAQVMIDRDLAHMYQVEAKQFNRQVQRNIERFPPDFMFRLSKEEAQDLRCQSGTSSWGGDRYLPSAFTEQGIAMLSGIFAKPKSNRGQHRHYAGIRCHAAISNLPWAGTATD